MLFSLLTLNNLAKEGIILYTAVYSLSTIGLFAILVRMKDYSFEGFNGLARRYPVVAFAATIFLLVPGRYSAYRRIPGQILYDCRRHADRPMALAGDFRPALCHGQRVLLFPGDPGHVF